MPARRTTLSPIPEDSVALEQQLQQRWYTLIQADKHGASEAFLEDAFAAYMITMERLVAVRARTSRTAPAVRNKRALSANPHAHLNTHR